VELKQRSAEEPPVTRSWITRVRIVAEGLKSQPYIHLDIRTPFGESVDDRLVDNALAESLGPRKERYGRVGWHLQFVEDTNLGSNHRVFVDLRDGESGVSSQPGMDAALPLEVAVEALAEAFQAKTGEQTFQLLVGGPRECFSALYAGGSPFHVLRVADPPGGKAAERLARHREFAQSQGKGSSFRTFLAPGDPLAACEPIRKLDPETVSLDLKPSGEGGAGEDPLLYLHYGLALAASRREYAAHNRVDGGRRLRNDSVRGRFRFMVAMGAAMLLCLLAAGGFALATHLTLKETGRLSAKASTYRTQVEAIRALRRENARIRDSLAGLRPLWNRPVRWHRVFADLSAALPEQAGIDGLAVNRGTDGTLSLSFRAWVKDWDHVRGIERKLAASPYLGDVSISEQRKDMATGAVVFHVSCRMEGE
jgi:hypothetical protein